MQQLAFWRNVAIVILGMECLVVLILLVALNYLLVRVTGNLHTVTRKYARKSQALTQMVAAKTDQYASTAIKPLITADTKATQVRESARTFLRFPKRPPEPFSEEPLKE